MLGAWHRKHRMVRFLLLALASIAIGYLYFFVYVMILAVVNDW